MLFIEFDPSKHRPPQQSLCSDAEFIEFIAKANGLVEAGTREADKREYETEMRALLRVPLENLLADELLSLAEQKPSTRRVYLAEVKRFKEFCDLAKMSVCPAAPELVCHFLLAEADKGASMSTINRQVAAIASAHRESGFADPTEDILVRAVVRHLGKAKPATSKAKANG